jgi:DNA polymerase I-like protein with 3'-5' exonuclease and polymerase domains
VTVAPAGAALQRLRPARRSTSVVTTKAQLREVAKAYADMESFAYDFETKGEKRNDPRHAIPFWISLAGPGRADVIPFGHPLGNVTGFEWSKLKKDGNPYANARQLPIVGDPPAQLSAETVFEALEPVLLGPAEKSGHGLKFDLEVAARYYGAVPPPPYFDTMVAAFLIDETHLGGYPYSLGSCVKREFRFEYDKSLGRIGVDKFPFAESARYSRLDSKYTWMLKGTYLDQIEEDGFTELFELEMKVLECVVWMEEAGVAIDIPGLDTLIAKVEAEMAATYARIETAAGYPINLNADAQIIKLLFGEWDPNLEHPRTGRRGRWTGPHQPHPDFVTKVRRDPQTSAAALQATASLRKNPIVKDILKWLELSKLHSTYLLNIKSRLHNGRCHADFDQRGTRTGRFSCRTPNLQNVPTRRSNEVRELFIAPLGYKLLVADYSQIELRMLAHYSRDPLLLKAYQDGLDLHTITARKAYHIPANEEPTKEQRSRAKNCNFSMAYGAQASTLVDKYGVPNLAEAQDLIDAFFGTYVRVDPWRRSVVRKCIQTRITRAEAKAKGCRPQAPYVTTILGRKRRLPDITSFEFGRARAAERQAVNTVIQGSAGDLIKLAMVELHRRLKDTPCVLMLTVHDELVVQAPDDMVEWASEQMRASMEDVPLKLRVPLVADITVCDRWSEK